jgi:hypothetical protein
MKTRRVNREIFFSCFRDGFEEIFLQPATSDVQPREVPKVGKQGTKREYKKTVDSRRKSKNLKKATCTSSEEVTSDERRSRLL